MIVDDQDIYATAQFCAELVAANENRTPTDAGTLVAVSAPPPWRQLHASKNHHLSDDHTN
jgi:hypothetical protein